MIRNACFFLLGVLVAIGISSIAGDWRLEAAGGKCQHRLAEDATWHYRYGGYQTSMELQPNCYQVGVAWMPKWRGDTRLGLRLAYVDLGTLKADNTYPVNEPEYFRAKDTGTAVNSETARFQGTGGFRGFTFGPALETPLYGDLYIGPEIGLAYLYGSWHVNAPEMGVVEGCRKDWACADGWKATWYVGVAARYEWLQVSWRRYANVHASNADVNYLFIGPTHKAVDQVTIGFTWHL